ncbi:MAG: hypothetical protein WCJ30_02640 [Deltaproteobacteria bacterium]
MLGALLASGCHAPRTQIVVWVWSDLPLTGPMSLDLLSISVTGGGRTDRPAYTIAVNPTRGGDASVRILPSAVLTLYPDDNTAAYEVSIAVAALHDVPGRSPEALYAYGAFQRTTAFAPGRSTQVDVYLTLACSQTRCEMDQTCGLNGCELIAQPASGFDGSFPADVVRRDASADLVAPTDAPAADEPVIADAVAMDTAIPPPSDSAAGCAAGRTDCGGACVNLSNDGSNCGSCGTNCGAGMSCSSGSCRCSSGTSCGGSCVNTQTDNSNCGSCGTRCLYGEYCANGTCICPSGTIWCTGTGCVNVSNDVSHCGSCGIACPVSSRCAAGVCSCVPDATCDGTVCNTRNNCGTLCTCRTGLMCHPGGCCCPTSAPCIC